MSNRFVERVERLVMADERQRVGKIFRDSDSLTGAVFQHELATGDCNPQKANARRQRIELKLRLGIGMNHFGNEILK